jgi:hypothetical protein
VACGARSTGAGRSKEIHMPRRLRTDLVRGALALAALLAAAPASAELRAAGSRLNPNPNTSSSPVATTNDYGGSFIDDGYECTCVEHYRNGVDAFVFSCEDDAMECPDLSLLADCRDDASTPGCDDYLVHCECDCTALEQTTEFEPHEDVMLTGIPELWQFDSRCDAITGIVPVGCGPVAGAMLLYHWAQLGYENLVEDFLISGSDPAVEVQDWQALVQDLRDDYLDGGFCVPFTGYATEMGKMASGLEDFIEDAGYDADVDHFKVCESCPANAADELTSNEGLSMIKTELKAGRPLIMGFNSSRAMRSETQVTNDDGETDWFYTGELSNGMPIGGTIDHYAVITGYFRLDGRDVISVNTGWGWPDLNFEWNPAGKWLHLYAVDIDGALNGDDWCSIDRGVTAFSPTSNVYMSHAYNAYDSEDNDLNVLAGDSCGIAREGETVRYFDETHTDERCPTMQHLPTESDLPLIGGGTSSGGTHGGTGWNGGGAPILDELEPLP